MNKYAPRSMTTKELLEWKERLNDKKKALLARRGAANGGATRQGSGYVQMSIPERREAVKELNGNGHSTREIADVVGVNHATVSRDLRVANATGDPDAGPQNASSNGTAVANATAGPDDPPPQRQRFGSCFDRPPP
jgi:DNA-binding NarL/FixJ family response regulator